MERSASVNRSGSLVDGSPIATDAFRAIAEITGDIAFIVDCPSGTLRYISPAVEQLLGHSPSDFAGQLIAPIAAGPLSRLCAGLPERLRRFRDGDTSRLRVMREFDIPDRGGQTVPIEVISTLIVDNAGRPVALAGLIRSLADRRALEAEQKRFASMLNHEFRTPLSTIDGAIQRLEATSIGADDATRQRYRKIGVAVDRLIGMLDEYLSPERMASIGRQRRPASIAPRQLLEEAATHVREAGRKATLSVGELPQALRCEPEGLRLALKVLVDNALSFSPQNTLIELDGRRVSDGIQLSVRDHGPGVTDADRPRIFDKFYRGNNAAGMPGSGLGLYMARSVVEVHGGTISLAEPDGRGAEFRIWLPQGGELGKTVASGELNSDNRPDRAR
jgi:PAS domain S-box-containing protein